MPGIFGGYNTAERQDVMKHTVGIIGYGGMAGIHYKELLNYDRARIKGVFDLDPKRLDVAKQQGLLAFSSKEELLADNEIDIILIATPNDAHMPLAIEAMAAGKNVICEK